MEELRDAVKTLLLFGFCLGRRVPFDTAETFDEDDLAGWFVSNDSK